MTWIVRDTERGNERECDSRSEAEETKQDLVGLGASPEQLEIVPPKASDGGQEAKQPEVVEDTQPERERAENESVAVESLPDKPPVDEDPISWMPSQFTDSIEGVQVINRQGYEVMAHHYGISTESECLVGPEENDFTFCRVVATATKPDGETYTAHGSAHVDRGDDSYLLLEMADTRARKRALAQATGTGMLAVEELQNRP